MKHPVNRIKKTSTFRWTFFGKQMKYLRKNILEKFFDQIHDT